MTGIDGAEDWLKKADVGCDRGPPKKGCDSGVAWLDIGNVPGVDETLEGVSSLVKKSNCD